MKKLASILLPVLCYNAYAIELLNIDRDPEDIAISFAMNKETEDYSNVSGEYTYYAQTLMAQYRFDSFSIGASITNNDLDSNTGGDYQDYTLVGEYLNSFSNDFKLNIALSQTLVDDSDSMQISSVNLAFGKSAKHYSTEIITTVNQLYESDLTENYLLGELGIAGKYVVNNTLSLGGKASYNTTLSEIEYKGDDDTLDINGYSLSIFAGLEITQSLQSSFYYSYIDSNFDIEGTSTSDDSIDVTSDEVTLEVRYLL